MSDSENKGCGCGCLLIFILLCYFAGGLRSCFSKKEPEKATGTVAAEKATPPKPFDTGKVLDNSPLQAPKSKSLPSPSQAIVPLSLNDNLSLQEKGIQQKVSGVLDLLRQLRQRLESGGVESKDEIRNRLKEISEAAVVSASQLKTSSELSKLRAVLGRLEEESRQNTRLSAGARLKTQELLLSKRQALERIEKLSVNSIRKLSDYEDSCDRWLSDFDTLWKIDGLQQASKQLLDDVSKLQELKAFTQPKALAEISKAVAVEETPVEKGFRTWTNIYGISEKARFLSADHNNVILEREDGTKFKLPLTLLFPEDQVLVSRLFSSLSRSSSQSANKKPFIQGALFVAQETPDGYLNVRSGPGLKYSIVGRIQSGSKDIMQVGQTFYDTKDQIIWMPVRFGEVKGFVSSNFLKPE